MQRFNHLRDDVCSRGRNRQIAYIDVGDTYYIAPVTKSQAVIPFRVEFYSQSHLNDVYAHFPEAEKRPVIGITGNYEDLTCKLGRGYYQSVVAAGGVPVVIPPVADKHVIVNTLEHIDALILSGGGDINPLWAGEEPSPKLHGINQERDLPELLIARLAYNRQIPMLGICRGIQTLATAFGGKVAQDISDVATIKHSQDADRSEPTHSVIIDEDSSLFDI